MTSKLLSTEASHVYAQLLSNPRATAAAGRYCFSLASSVWGFLKDLLGQKIQTHNLKEQM